MTFRWKIVTTNVLHLANHHVSYPAADMFLFLLFLSFFYSSDSVWYSSHRSSLCSHVFISRGTKTQSSILEQQKRTNKRPSYQYRCSSSAWYLEPRAASDTDRTSDMNHHSGRYLAEEMDWVESISAGLTGPWQGKIKIEGICFLGCGCIIKTSTHKQD